ncbi:MAG: PH domain-containing protein [Oscillospiraceae bacterium]|nr:PH domain-containing protein [Oscillospiraceae bacterium]
MASYIEKRLSKDETVVMEAKVHWCVLVERFVVLLVLVGFVGFLHAILFSAFPGETNMTVPYLIAVFIGLITIGVGFLTMKTTTLALTNKRLVGKYGIINTVELNAPLDKINDLTLKRGLGGLILGYKTICVNTSSVTSNFRYMGGTDAFRTAIMEETERFKKSGGSSS